VWFRSCLATKHNRCRIARFLKELARFPKEYELERLLSKVAAMLPTARKARLFDIASEHLAEISYFRLAEHGFYPSGIVDIGAYQGDWTKLIAKIFPEAPILMIEAQAAKKAHLDAVCRALPEVDYALCLLGEKDGAETVFNVMETGSSVYAERSNVARAAITMPVHTLDNLLSRFPQIKAPLFMKLDVQGSELDVLRGSSCALKIAEVVQLELALMNYNEGAPAADAVIEFMAKHDFVLYDVCGFIKPNPQFLSQIDVLFARKESMLRRDYFVF
jgi:FkbM family methyltransferase